MVIKPNQRLNLAARKSVHIIYKKEKKFFPKFLSPKLGVPLIHECMLYTTIVDLGKLKI